jgi:hypothetical protein
MIEQFLVGDLQHSYYTLYVPQTLIRSLYRVIVFMMGGIKTFTVLVMTCLDSLGIITFFTQLLFVVTEP